MQWIRSFREISKHDVNVAGGKGASLGEMTQAGIPVPPGFVILVGAPGDIENEMLEAFDRLGAKRVAVRSSATVEDAASASWAGQFDTYLHVSRDDLIDAVHKCRTCVKSERVETYRIEKNIDAAAIEVAVVVQAMVNADAAGVCFTVHPVTKDKNSMIIEACRGLGDKLVSGEATPDGYVVDKASNAIVDIYQAEGQRVLDNETILKLAQVCRRVEEHYGFPCDIEWAMTGGELCILQSRPITTL